VLVSSKIRHYFHCSKWNKSPWWRKIQNPGNFVTIFNPSRNAPQNGQINRLPEIQLGCSHTPQGYPTHNNTTVQCSGVQVWEDDGVEWEQRVSLASNSRDAVLRSGRTGQQGGHAPIVSTALHCTAHWMRAGTTKSSRPSGREYDIWADNMS
jgi:hypothetical protein